MGHGNEGETYDGEGCFGDNYEIWQESKYNIKEAMYNEERRDGRGEIIFAAILACIVGLALVIFTAYTQHERREHHPDHVHTTQGI